MRDVNCRANDGLERLAKNCSSPFCLQLRELAKQLQMRAKPAAYPDTRFGSSLYQSA